MKTIVIAPYLAHKNISNNLRKNDQFINLKFFTKETFLNNCYFQYSESALLYLINKYSLDYDVAEDYLRTIAKLSIENSENSKINKLISLKKELENEQLIFKNDYFEKELSESKILIYFYADNDLELINHVSKFNYEFIKNNGDTPTEIHKFHTNNDQLSYLFNCIASLLEKGVKGNEISIYGLQSTDQLIFERLVSNYNFHFNNAYPKTLLSKNYINRFLANILFDDITECLNNAKIESENDETFNEFEKIILKYRNESLKPLQQIELYKGMLEKKKLENEVFSDGINIVKEPISPDGGYLFIVNMAQGKYPTLKRDNDYLSDSEKESIGLVTSEQENSANRQLFINFLQQNSTIFLMYSETSFAEKYYLSPLVNDLGISISDTNEDEIFYCSDELQITYASLCDVERNYLSPNKLLGKLRNTKEITIPYMTYDFQTRGIKHYNFEQEIKLSYSSTKTYYECPYKFYLNKILKIDELESTFNLNLGTLIHFILQHINDGDSFEETYEKAIENLNLDFDVIENVLLNRLKEDIKRVFEFIKNFENQVNQGKFLRETDFDISLDECVSLKGKIDKIVFSSESKDITIIDYKIGSEEFKDSYVPYGLSLQLPTYALYIKNKKPDNKIAGLFIQSVLLDNSSSLFSRVESTDLTKCYKLKGLVNEEIEIIKKVDNSINFDYISGLSYKADGTLKKTNCLRNEQYLDQLADQANDLIINAGRKILNNEFQINPKMINEQDCSCKWCPYKDICYRKESAYSNFHVGKEEEKQQ